MGGSHDKLTQIDRVMSAAAKLTPVDMHSGGRMRLRRTMLGLSQESPGGSLGLTFQQVQKYERGANRIGAGRLLQLANIWGYRFHIHMMN